MDDFGSGYSSLNMLKDMPVDVVKIDMGFLRKAEDDARARTILSSIMQMTSNLCLASVTEGVETEEQFAAMKCMGCGMFQGYLFAKPMSVEAFEEFLDLHRRTARLAGRKKSGADSPVPAQNENLLGDVKIEN